MIMKSRRSTKNYLNTTFNSNIENIIQIRGEQHD